jgi:hypothetical protein
LNQLLATTQLHTHVDKSLLPAIIGALATAIVAGMGWVAVHVLSSRREVAARRDSAAHDHLEHQIEQLYGPLLGLIQHAKMAFNVATKKLPTDADGKIDFPRFSDRDAEIWRYFIESYFLPVNAEIRKLIRSKMHLLEAGTLPKSFVDFFEHEVGFEALHRLWKEKGVDSLGISGKGWPKDLESDTQNVLNELLTRHQLFLRRLGVRHRKEASVNAESSIPKSRVTLSLRRLFVGRYARKGSKR